MKQKSEPEVNMLLLAEMGGRRAWGRGNTEIQQRRTVQSRQTVAPQSTGRYSCTMRTVGVTRYSRYILPLTSN